MKIYLFLFTVLFFYLLKAQAPEIQWSRTYGGSGYDVAEDIYPTVDGGFIVAGNSTSSDGDVSGHNGPAYYTDYWIVKLNSIGDILWEKSFGGDDQDFAHSIQQTNDGGYVVAGGGFESGFNPSDFYVVKLNPEGNVEWEKFLGGTYFSEEAYSIQQTADNGYILTGFSYTNSLEYRVIKLDASGEVQWDKEYGGTELDTSYSVRQTTDGGFILAGFSYSENGDLTENQGGADVWVLKLTESGEIDWQKSYGGTNHDGNGTGIVRGVNIIQTINGGYAFAACSLSRNGDVSGNNGSESSTTSDYWIVQLDNSGNIVWEKNFGGYYTDDPKSIQQTNDGGFIVTGYSESGDGDVSNHHGEDRISTDCWVIKVDSQGNKLWENSYGGTSDEKCWSIKQLADNSYIVAGWTASNDGDVTSNHGDVDMWILKLNPDHLLVTEIIIEEINLYPNPVHDLVNFSERLTNIEIYSTDGKKILSSKTASNINVSSLPSGNYFLKALSLKGKPIQTKFIKN